MSDCRILVVAHAPLAAALKACAVHVFGAQAEDVLALDVRPEHDVSHWLTQAPQLLGASQAPLLILTDVFGATPFNVARALADWSCARGVPAQVLTGANVPMLLRAMTYRDESLPELLERAESGAVQGVIHVSPKRGVQQANRPAHDSGHHHHHQ